MDAIKTDTPRPPRRGYREHDGATDWQTCDTCGLRIGRGITTEYDAAYHAGDPDACPVEGCDGRMCLPELDLPPGEAKCADEQRCDTCGSKLRLHDYDDKTGDALPCDLAPDGSRYSREQLAQQAMEESGLAAALHVLPPSGEPTEHRITRDDARDLVIAGWLIGEGSWSPDRRGSVRPGESWDVRTRLAADARARRVLTRVYLTTTGRLVTSEVYYGDDGAAVRAEAEVHDTAADAINSLSEDGARLPRSAKAALEAACAAWPPLAGLDVERVS